MARYDLDIVFNINRFRSYRPNCLYIIGSIIIQLLIQCIVLSAHVHGNYSGLFFLLEI